MLQSLHLPSELDKYNVLFQVSIFDKLFKAEALFIKPLTVTLHTITI